MISKSSGGICSSPNLDCRLAQ